MLSLEEMKQALLKALAYRVSLNKPNLPIETPSNLPQDASNIPTPNVPTPSLDEITAIHDPAWCGGTVEERKAMQLLTQKIFQEINMPVELGKDMWGTIWGESGWNQFCQNHRNANGSADYGIGQFNSNTYLKEFNMTPVEALLNPEKCIRIMAQCFKDGRRRNWFGFRPTDLQFQKNRTRML